MARPAPPTTRFGPPVIQRHTNAVSTGVAPPATKYGVTVPVQPKQLSKLPVLANGASARLTGGLPKSVNARVLQAMFDEVKTNSCGAKLYYGLSQSINGTIDGNYNSSSGIHAEMDALCKYVDAFYTVYKFNALQVIAISSPCCKVCNRIFKALGIRKKAVNEKFETYPEKPYGSCNGSYGMPSSDILRKLIYDTIGDMSNPYNYGKKEDYNKSMYWQLLKDDTT